MKIKKIFLAPIIFAFSLLFFAVAATALAVDYQPLVNIPGFTPTTGSTLTGYLSGLYNFLISIVGILAMGVIIYGGMRYVVSAGNPAAMEDAKEAIWSAVYGLALALGSWLIINVVNPDILVLKNPGVEEPKGTYAYNQSSTPRCFTNPGNPDVYDLNEGTKENPCQCLDGTEQVTTKTRANLTLSLSPTNPAPSAPSGSMTASGKLTDDKGNGISGKTIKINRVNAALKASSNFTATTATDGSFTITSPVPCSDTATRQAVFDGDTAYTFAVSNPVTLTIGGTPTCTAGSYMNSPADVSILPVGFCQNLCSDTTGNFADDSKFHCAIVKLGVGTTPEQAMSGNQSLSILYNTPVFIDAVTNIKSPYGIGKVEIYGNINWITWLLGPSNICIFNSACGTIGCNLGFGDKDWTPAQVGKFIRGYSGGTANAGVDAYVINPATGLCDLLAIEDRGVSIQVSNP